MNRLQRTSPLVLVTFGVIGIGAGMLLQFGRSAQGAAPLVPPISLAFTLVLLGVILVTLGVALRRAVTRKSGKAVDPFHAVRLLAGARAGQFVGALIGGFGGGLALQLLTRSVMPPAPTWVPMVLVFGGGLVLTACAYIAELLCRVPPTDSDDTTESGLADPEPDPA